MLETDFIFFVIDIAIVRPNTEKFQKNSFQPKFAGFGENHNNRVNSWGFSENPTIRPSDHFSEFPSKMQIQNF